MTGLSAASMSVLLAVFVAVLAIASGAEDLAEDAEKKHRVCNLPIDPGPCDGSTRMFYFDAKTGSCKRFSYGGCDGNKNRFKTKAECEKRCTISNDEMEPICPAEPPETDPHCAERMCPSSGCPEGKICCSYRCGHTCEDPVSGQTTEDAKKKNIVCNLPMDPGPCEAAIRMFYFNAKTGSCKRFSYGGCEGNKNRFKTKAECEKRCKITTDATPGPMPEVCGFKEDAGECRAAFERYFYSKAEEKCMKFIYGGCEGNGNNFKSRAECRKMCK